jgi:ArsR family transcriptional regulator, arsenate/arsenite/antimonite-responsive transcriptional repressor
MASPKTEAFTEQQVRLAEVFKALGHPARIAIMEALVARGSCVCGDLVSDLPLAQSTVSQHLKVLKDAGIIMGETEGTYTCYCADKEECKMLIGVVGQFLSKLVRCC